MAGVVLKGLAAAGTWIATRVGLDTVLTTIGLGMGYHKLDQQGKAIDTLAETQKQTAKILETLSAQTNARSDSAPNISAVVKEGTSIKPQTLKGEAADNLSVVVKSAQTDGKGITANVKLSEDFKCKASQMSVDVQKNVTGVCKPVDPQSRAELLVFAKPQ